MSFLEVCGLLVITTPERVERVLALLRGCSQLTVYGADRRGVLVVTAQSEVRAGGTNVPLVDILTRIKNIRGVVAIERVYDYREPEAENSSSVRSGPGLPSGECLAIPFIKGIFQR
jgi:nitrate reductase NapAB chaperone NapD